jgi:hypothetical protein
MEKLTQHQYDILRHEIYLTLMNTFDEEGNEMSLGEMGICTEQAEIIIFDWIGKAGIELDF